MAAAGQGLQHLPQLFIDHLLKADTATVQRLTVPEAFQLNEVATSQPLQWHLRDLGRHIALRVCKYVCREYLPGDEFPRTRQSKKTIPGPTRYFLVVEGPDGFDHEFQHGLLIARVEASPQTFQAWYRKTPDEWAMPGFHLAAGAEIFFETDDQPFEFQSPTVSLDGSLAPESSASRLGSSGRASQSSRSRSGLRSQSDQSDGDGHDTAPNPDRGSTPKGSAMEESDVASFGGSANAAPIIGLALLQRLPSHSRLNDTITSRIALALLNGPALLQSLQEGPPEIGSLGLPRPRDGRASRGTSSLPSIHSNDSIPSIATHESSVLDIPIIDRMEKRTVLVFLNKKGRTVGYQRLSDTPSLGEIFHHFSVANRRYGRTYHPDILELDINDGETFSVLSAIQTQTYRAMIRAISNSRCWDDGDEARCIVKLGWYWSWEGLRHGEARPQ